MSTITKALRESSSLVSTPSHRQYAFGKKKKALQRARAAVYCTCTLWSDARGHMERKNVFHCRTRFCFRYKRFFATHTTTHLAAIQLVAQGSELPVCSSWPAALAFAAPCSLQAKTKTTMAERCAGKERSQGNRIELDRIESNRVHVSSKPTRRSAY